MDISEIGSASSNDYEVTFNIIYSLDSHFRSPMRGVLTLRLSEFVDLNEIDKLHVEKVASALAGQVLMRGRAEDGSVTVFHLLGMPLGDWLNKSTKKNAYR